MAAGGSKPPCFQFVNTITQKTMIIIGILIGQFVWHMDHKPGLEQDYSILIFVVLKVIYLDTDVVK